MGLDKCLSWHWILGCFLEEKEGFQMEGYVMKVGMGTGDIEKIRYNHTDCFLMQAFLI